MPAKPTDPLPIVRLIVIAVRGARRLTAISALIQVGFRMHAATPVATFLYPGGGTGTLVNPGDGWRFEGGEADPAFAQAIWHTIALRYRL